MSKLLYQSFARRSLATVASISVLATVGCADDSALPSEGRLAPAKASHAVSTSSNAHVGLPPRTKNSVKYKDAGKKPATGRDGNATVQARALIDKTGTTTLDVTTGQLDMPGAPGAFDKVQVKGLNPNDLTQALWTDNYNSLRKAGLAAYTYTYRSLGYGAPVQVQANVSGIDSRADVVTLVERVKRRPDLAVMEIQAPAQALPNVSVTLGATVRELNGDVGAKADCVLYVNGVEADRAKGIWADAASGVSCAFAHQFSQPGTYQLTATVEGVTPGDWDTSNNQAVGSITIRPLGDFFYNAYVEDVTDYHYTYYYDDSYSFLPQGGSTSSWTNHQEYTQDGKWQQAQFTGYINTEIPFPISMQGSHASAGVATLGSLGEVTSQWSSAGDDGNQAYRTTCGWGYVDGSLGQLQIELCSSAWKQYSTGVYAGDDQWHGQSSFWVTRWAGDVTYTSIQYYRAHNSGYGDCSGVGPDGNDYCYFSNDSGSIQSGLPLPSLGDTYTMTFSVTGADNITHGSTANVALVPADPRTWNYDQPYTCWIYSTGDYEWSSLGYRETRNTCTAQHISGSGRQGWDSGIPALIP